MEESNRGDFHGNLIWQTSLKPGRNLNSSLSGRLSPRNSPSFRRSHSIRTPRREPKGGGSSSNKWFRNNRVLFWLILITLWAYIGLYVQSKWAHGDNKESFIGFEGMSKIIDSNENRRRDLIGGEDTLYLKNGTGKSQINDSQKMHNVKSLNVVVVKNKNNASSQKNVSSRRKNRKPGRSLHDKTHGKYKTTGDDERKELVEDEEEIPKRNTSYGLFVGPFGSTQDRILEWSPEKRSGTCKRKGDFERLVWSRKFVLIFHELSMTGAPLSMMELAAELLSCGATVSVVALSKKGGLMEELSRRRIKVLEDRAELSFKASMKADLIIAGSAVCASWIEQYIAHFTAGSNQILWWIMENRREYFDRSKHVLSKVKMTVFISESQSKQWVDWCKEENIRLNSQTVVVPLCVNDELAFAAGIPSSLNTQHFSTEKMSHKRNLLRNSVRKDMGLTDEDMLLLSLSSINPGKGQLLLLESLSLLVEKTSQINFNIIVDETPNGSHFSNKSSINLKSPKRTQIPKLLIGSVRSKSNKVPYVKGLLRFISSHSSLSKLVLWTPATTRVASLYSAADVYVINSQGIGETFGRVTIEAMAFGLPVVGTDAGGTKEIVEHNVTGLLHPVTRAGNEVLSRNLHFLLTNPSERMQMGKMGRRKVQKMYLKQQMYDRLAAVFNICMRVR